MRTVPPQKSKAEVLLLEEDSRERLTAADRREFFETLIADFERNPQRSFQWAPQLLRAATGDDAAALALRSVGTALLGQGQRMLGLHAFLELARLELPHQIEVERGPRRIVAFDRQLAADLKDLLHACSPAERQQADKRIQLALERTIEQGTSSSFGRVFKRLRSVGLDRSLRRKIDAALGPGRGVFSNSIGFVGGHHEQRYPACGRCLAGSWPSCAARMATAGKPRFATVDWPPISARCGSMTVSGRPT